MTTHALPKNGFTTRYLDTLKSEPKRFELADPGTKGLRLRVSPGGTKTFIWYYRDGSKIRRLTLGQYGDGDNNLTLVKARQKLITTKARLTEGIKPHAESANAPKTVADLCEFFYQRRIEGVRKRPDVVRQVLDHDIIPVIGIQQISSITTPTLARAIDKVVDRGATVHANKVLGTLKQVFNFAQARGFVDRSPAHPLKGQDLGVVSNIRERALDAEGTNLLPIGYFTPHDLRRTLRTHLSRLGVAPHIAEKCLNHSLSKLGKTYDKHTYLDERREALEKWATVVDLAVNPREILPITSM
jgi:integrase